MAVEPNARSPQSPADADDGSPTLSRRQRSSVATYLWLGFGLVIAVSAGISVVSLLAMTELKAAFSDVAEVSEPLSQAAYELEINTIGAGMGVFKYLHQPDAAYRDRFVDDNQDFALHYKDFAELVAKADGAFLADEVARLHARYSALGASLVHTKDREVAASRRLNDLRAELRQQLTDLDGFLAYPEGPRQRFQEGFRELALALATWTVEGDETSYDIARETLQRSRVKLENLIERSSSILQIFVHRFLQEESPNI